MKTLIFIVIIFIFLFTETPAQVAQNWRGPERMGIYHESGLLQEWPEGGPEMLWAFEHLGEGFSSPVIANGKVYITGMEGETGYIYILSMNGSLEKKFPYGPEFTDSYQGSRSTPAVVDDLLYIASGHGILLCIELNNGEIKWRRDLFKDFDGINIRWGLTENLLVDGDRLYCAPGGKKYNVVALNRHNGEVIWASEGQGEVSAYCSPLIVDHNGRRLLVTIMQNNIIGIDDSNGSLLWSHPHIKDPDVHPNTPIFHGGSIYVFSGYGLGGVKLKLNASGDSVTEEWENTDLDNQIGGAVLVDGYVYGAGHRNRFWFCVDWETGATVHSSRNIDKGTVIYADGRLYCYTERGELAIVEPSPEGFNIKGQTVVRLGSAQHWAHLVINNGVLYVRHGNAIMAYKIS